MVHAHPSPHDRHTAPAWLDRLAVGASALCLAHCLALPVVIASLPTLGWLSDDERVHWLLLAFALPVGLYALGRARGAAGWLPLAIGGAGLALMAIGVGLLARTPGERWLTVAGVVLVAAGHLIKFRANRRAAARGPSTPIAPR